MAKKNRAKGSAKPIRKQPTAKPAPQKAKRSRLPILIGSALALTAAAYGVYHFGFAGGYEGPVKHVIIISLDTTRPDHFGCYGNATVKTPEIDALAKESILFTDAMTVAPTTLASHTSLFTGNHPHSHGTPRNGHMVNQDNVMLAEILKNAGFSTQAFIASMALESLFGIDQGFDLYNEDFEMMFAKDRGADQSQRRGESVTNAVIDHLDANGVPDHLFLFAHYFDAHVPYDAPPPYETMYNASAPTRWPVYPAIRHITHLTAGQPNPHAVDLAQRYAGEISYMDHQVGRLIDDLRKRGILDESILIITSDHGENFWEHGVFFDHGYTTYQTTMQIVCMVRLPNAIHGNKRIDKLISNIDILPSLLQYLGLPAAEGIDGRAFDLANAVVPGESRRFGEATKPHDAEPDPAWFNALKARCIREGKYKFIHTPWKRDPRLAKHPMRSLPWIQFEELYDLSADPMERNNLLNAPTPEIARLADDLRAKLKAWAALADPLPSQFEPTQKERVLKDLKALGYVEDNPIDAIKRDYPVDSENVLQDPFIYKLGEMPAGTP